MRGLKNFLFKDKSSHLPDELRLALEAWRQTPTPSLDEMHFHTRYLVLDIATSGVKIESDVLRGLAISGVQHGVILPNDAFFAEMNEPGNEAAANAFDRQLMAFLQFAAKAPIVTYHVPFVAGFLQRAFKERLGLNFQPAWIDIAWLLPSIFEEKGHTLKPLDYWIEAFGLDAGNGRRSVMENNLMLARIFQMVLVRAMAKGINTASGLIDESHASSQLRRSH